MNIPENPLENFPSGYTPRPSQEKTILWLSEHLKDPNTKYFILTLPTGSGKSHIAATVAKWSLPVPEDLQKSIVNYTVQKSGSSEEFLDLFQRKKFGAFILTVTKSLQDQYKKLFPEFTLGKGMGEFTCQIPNQTHVPVNVAICQHIAPGIKNKICFPKNICPYFKSKNEALASQVAVLNYSFLLSLKPEFVKNRQLLICDEADVLEEEITIKNTFEFPIKILKDLGLFDPSSFDTLLLKWNKNQFYKFYDYIDNRYNALISLLKNEGANWQKKKKNKFLILIQRVKEIHEKLSHVRAFYSSAKYDISYDIENEKLVCIPCEIEPFIKDLFQYADKIIFMSATILKPDFFAEVLGLPKGSWKHLELDSTFDPNKSPIFFDSRHNINFKNKHQTIPFIVDLAIKIALKKHPQEKGIIHTHSFEICHYFKQALDVLAYKQGPEYVSRFLVRTEEDTNHDIIKKHFESLAPTVLISPSLDTGISLDGDFGRFQIICKAPYAPWTNPRIEYMRKKYPFFYQWNMLSTFIQMCGRCTRNEEDYSITYCLDAKLRQEITRFASFFPSYFIKRIV